MRFGLALLALAACFLSSGCLRSQPGPVMLPAAPVPPPAVPQVTYFAPPATANMAPVTPQPGPVTYVQVPSSVPAPQAPTDGSAPRPADPARPIAAANPNTNPSELTSGDDPAGASLKSSDTKGTATNAAGAAPALGPAVAAPANVAGMEFQGKNRRHWLRMARDLDPDFRRRAVAAIGAFARQGDAESTQLLMAIVQQADHRSETQLRVDAIDAVADVGARRHVPKLAPLLIELAQSDDPAATQRTLHRATPRDKALAALVTATACWDREKKALRAGLEHPRTEPVCGVALLVVDPSSAATALNALKRSEGPGLLPPLQQRAPEVMENLIGVFKQGEPSVQAAAWSLVNTLLERGSKTRIFARMPPQRILTAARKTLQKGDVANQQEAVRALGHLGADARPAEPQLIRLLAAEDRLLRSRAADVLPKITADRGKLATRLQQQFPKAASHQQLGILQTLGRLRVPSAKPLLVESAKSKEPAIREQAVLALLDHPKLDDEQMAVITEVTMKENDRDRSARYDLAIVKSPASGRFLAYLQRRVQEAGNASKGDKQAAETVMQMRLLLARVASYRQPIRQPTAGLQYPYPTATPAAAQPYR